MGPVKCSRSTSLSACSTSASVMVCRLCCAEWSCAAAVRYSVNMLAAEFSVVRASLVTIARSGSAFFTARAVRLAACSCSMAAFPPKSYLYLW